MEQFLPLPNNLCNTSSNGHPAILANVVDEYTNRPSEDDIDVATGTTQRGAQLQLTVRTARTAIKTIISESLPEDKALPVPYLPPRGLYKFSLRGRFTTNSPNRTKAGMVCEKLHLTSWGVYTSILDQNSSILDSINNYAVDAIRLSRSGTQARHPTPSPC
ncbi:uncharacterized protein H6S33_005873 [Morchella sextelata]|uniref:uncharacterized protein n=1 Tax=Morchella sextelata TaxID=1174677 RepID=UPI001D043407|nr:uncharacterized protein H6S33_005873 [Morchella sextelata]KAH0613987.1 hypothetical protein H6S33_005873 [Morchella sextelata]